MHVTAVKMQKGKKEGYSSPQENRGRSPIWVSKRARKGKVGQRQISMRPNKIFYVINIFKSLGPSFLFSFFRWNLQVFFLTQIFPQWEHKCFRFWRPCLFLTFFENYSKVVLSTQICHCKIFLKISNLELSALKLL